MKVYSIQTAFRAAPKLVYAEVPDTVCFSAHIAVDHYLADLARDLEQAKQNVVDVENQIIMAKKLTAVDAQPRDGIQPKV